MRREIKNRDVRKWYRKDTKVDIFIRLYYKWLILSEIGRLRMYKVRKSIICNLKVCFVFMVDEKFLYFFFVYVLIVFTVCIMLVVFLYLYIVYLYNINDV